MLWFVLICKTIALILNLLAINEPVGPIYKFFCIEKKEKKEATFYFWKQSIRPRSF